MPTSDLVVAGVPVATPLEDVARYAWAHSKTITTYDLADRGDPHRLTEDEVGRTWVISSRISKAERRWFVERAESAPWSAVPPGAELRDADPSHRGELYDDALALYEHFRTGRPRGVDMAKISKVLHLKRPALIPILDSSLRRRYQTAARDQARRLPDRGARRLYWAAIRDDLEHNDGALRDLRDLLSRHDDERVRRLGALTDLRLLDICTWRP